MVMDFPPDFSDLPPVLYKYRSFDEFGWRVLTELEVFFASPEHFNDPFDTRVPVLYEQGTLKQVYKKNLENLKYVPILTRAERKRHARQMARTTYANRNDPKRREEFRKSVNEKTSQMAGILSLSAVRDHTLMWSHYADSHRGFCIGFDSQELLRFADRKAYEGVFLLPGQVCYYNEFPQINPYKMTDAQVFMTKLFSKSKEWRYEEEYRVLCGDRTDFALQLDPATLHSVTLGARCRPEDKCELIELFRRNEYEVSLEEARAGDEGKIEFTPLSTTSI